MVQQAKQGNYEAFDAGSWRLGIVVAEFNKHITDQLYDSALKRAAEYNLSPDKIDTIRVAGSVELPLALQKMAQTGQYKALLALGCIIRGETAHFDYVAKFATEGVLRVELDTGLPIGFGVLTCEDEAQAEARGHLGSEFLDAALQLAKSLSN